MAAMHELHNFLWAQKTQKLKSGAGDFTEIKNGHHKSIFKIFVTAKTLNLIYGGG